MASWVKNRIPSVDPRTPDKAQIAVEGGDDLYREIRIENTLIDQNGAEVRLKPGAQVEVTIEADPQDTVKKQPDSATATQSKE
jgi:hypothetical protein